MQPRSFRRHLSIDINDVKKQLIDRLLTNNVQFEEDEETGELILPTGFYANASSKQIQNDPDPDWGTLNGGKNVSPNTG